MLKRAFLPLVAVALAFAALPAVRAQDAAPAATPATTPQAAIKDIRIVLHTDKGDVEATLFATKAPVTTANFLNLAQQHFYDGLKFHRVIPGFMSQGGDPQGTGMGGPGYTFPDEPNGDRRFDKAGVFAMANRGKDTNGSQFFITHGPVPHLNDGGDLRGALHDLRAGDEGSEPDYRNGSGRPHQGHRHPRSDGPAVHRRIQADRRVGLGDEGW